VENGPVRRAATPGSHPLVRAAWLGAGGMLAIAVFLAVVARAVGLAVFVAGAALLLLLLGYVVYMGRHLIFARDLARAEAALAAGDLEGARRILAPLLDLYPGIAVVQRLSGLALYRLGDPLSAAALLERAARSYADDAELAATLVACYAALNRGADARRPAALLPRHADVRLALAWSELVALGGDRIAGEQIAAELRERADVREAPARAAMCAALAAIAHARRGAETSARAALEDPATRAAGLSAFDRAFLGYLEGVALREAGAADDALRAWERAMSAAPGTIGEALARRERANLLARHSSSSLQPSTEPSSSA